jgi:hypothetical protein
MFQAHFDITREIGLFAPQIERGAVASLKCTVTPVTDMAIKANFK